MLAKPVRKDEQIKLIIECRQSGLTDYEWCNQHGIKPGTFYNWVKRLKKSEGHSFPRSCTDVPHQQKQEVVKLDLSPLERPTSIVNDQYNNSAVMMATQALQEPAMQINVSGCSITIPNGTDPRLLETALKVLGGLYAR
jgi:transposase-like protein